MENFFLQHAHTEEGLMVTIFKNDVALLIGTEERITIHILPAHSIMKTNEVYGQVTHVHKVTVRSKWLDLVHCHI